MRNIIWIREKIIKNKTIRYLIKVINYYKVLFLAQINLVQLGCNILNRICWIIVQLLNYACLFSKFPLDGVLFQRDNHISPQDLQDLKKKFRYAYKNIILSIIWLIKLWIQNNEDKYSKFFELKSRLSKYNSLPHSLQYQNHKYLYFHSQWISGFLLTAGSLFAKPYRYSV